MLKSLLTVIKSYLTGPDGVSYAPGRLMAMVLFAICQVTVILTVHHALSHNIRTSGWPPFLQGIAIFEGMTSSVCVALILGIAPTDPQGKWWGKDASPPGPSVQ